MTIEVSDPMHVFPGTYENRVKLYIKMSNAEKSFRGHLVYRERASTAYKLILVSLFTYWLQDDVEARNNVLCHLSAFCNFCQRI